MRYRRTTISALFGLSLLTQSLIPFAIPANADPNAPASPPPTVAGAIDTEGSRTNTLATSSTILAAVEEACAFAFQNTHDPIGPLGKLAVSQLQAFGKALGVPIEQLQSPKVADYGAFVIAVTNNWIYTADVAGNPTFRPISNLPSMTASLDNSVSIENGKPDESQILSLATSFAATILPNRYSDLSNSVYRRGQLADAEPAVPSWTMPVDDLFPLGEDNNL